MSSFILFIRPWDFGKFLPEQCALSGIPVPSYANKWINLRKHWYRYYKFTPDQPVTFEVLLEKLGMSFDGRPHSGIDDARNIAKLLVKMVHDGLEARVNDDSERHKRLRMNKNQRQGGKVGEENGIE